MADHDDSLATALACVAGQSIGKSVRKARVGLDTEMEG
jgi:hypothetical protein